MACQTAFGHLDEGALSKHHHHLREKLELFQDQTMEAKRKYNKAVCELHNEKQRQWNQQTWENLEQYRNEQPVVDLECQLAGKLVDTKTMSRHTSILMVNVNISPCSWKSTCLLL